ncbi:MAG: leukotoxin LktA family filamentous adhesin, partial [Hyphomicrobiales bacterium]|nr:leukotoxin LktA family filamentous adhesin [Hyphomicrobiales bacterium]
MRVASPLRCWTAQGRGAAPVTSALRAALLASPSPLVLSLVATLVAPGLAHAQAVNLGGSPNIIVPDGRTATHVTVNGDTTSITTDTISRGTAFNSFSDFKEAAGQQVNLYVPDQAGNLLNIVRNGSVVIDGVLNSYKNGKIGGNVYFSDPHGFIVGQKGSINVGALTVNTPTGKFLDGVIGADGAINDDAAGQLMRGEIPISPDGLISISGTISAQDGITLQGQTVSITGRGGVLSADELTQRQKFDATVNSTGIQEGGALVSHNGTISIVAAGNVHVGGKVDVGSRKTGGTRGKIDVKSGGDIAIDAAAVFNADGYLDGGDAGEINIKADQTLSVASGAQFSAHGYGTSTGGFLELSGHLAKIGTIHADLGSDNGQAGTLLFDPLDLLIDATNGSVQTNGASVVLQADHSITVAAGGSIDTRQISGGISTGNSGSITLTSSSITIANGATLDAGVSTGSTFSAGDIILTASATNGTAQILIGQGTGTAPVVAGKDITLTATATAGAPTLLVSTPTAHAAITINSAQVTASGTLRATATAATAGSVSLLPIGVVVTNVTSSVDVIGNAVVHAASAAFNASSSATSKISTQSLAPPNSSVDGAVAISTVNSSATSHVGGSAQLTIAGVLSLSADNTVVSTAEATPQAAAFGASVAVSVVTATTGASIDGTATIGAGSLSLAASTSTTITVTAAAAAGGATAPDSGSQAAHFLGDAGYSADAKTSSGNVSVVGALAISDLTSITTASMNSTQQAVITGALGLSSTTSNSAAVTADGSAVDSTIGVGAAVGLNLAKVRNDATLSQSVSATGVSVSALMNGANGANSFTTSATSGAGGENVGVAGSVAVNLVDTESVASMAAGAVVVAGGGVSLTSADQSKSSALAKADVTGGKVGVGASIATNIVANRALATIADGIVVTNATDLTLSAIAAHEITTEADAGSAGGISVTPALALSMVNNTTTAQLGTLAGTQAVSGNILISAKQRATETTEASGIAAGSKAAVGAALALALINDNVTATTKRSLLSSGGAIGFTAWGASLSTLTAEASASGAAGDDTDSSKVDDKVDGQLGGADTKQKSAGVGDSTQQTQTKAGVDNKNQRSASSNGSKVSVAAAIGVSVQQSTVLAAVPDGVAITATTGALTIAAVNNTDGS